MSDILVYRYVPDTVRTLTLTCWGVGGLIYSPLVAAYSDKTPCLISDTAISSQEYQRKKDRQRQYRWWRGWKVLRENETNESVSDAVSARAQWCEDVHATKQGTMMRDTLNDVHTDFREYSCGAEDGVTNTCGEAEISPKDVCLQCNVFCVLVFVVGDWILYTGHLRKVESRKWGQMKWFDST